MNDNDDIRDRPPPHRPCYLGIDKHGKIRGRYRFAHLAVLETTENGWELQMEGCEE